MNFLLHRQTQRGSVEVILLLIVLVAIAALITWKSVATWQAQEKAEQAAKANQARQAILDKDRTIVETLKVSFKMPEGHGSVIVTKPQAGDFPSVQLAAEKLQKARYNCQGENTGVFGTLALEDPSDNGPQPQFTKKLGDKTFGFTNGLNKACYSDELLEEFRMAVPEAIVESLKIVKTPKEKPAKEE